MHAYAAAARAHVARRRLHIELLVLRTSAVFHVSLLGALRRTCNAHATTSSSIVGVIHTEVKSLFRIAFIGAPDG
jgi:hypothetical protein